MSNTFRNSTISIKDISDSSIKISGGNQTIINGKVYSENPKVIIDGKDVSNDFFTEKETVIVNIIVEGDVNNVENHNGDIEIKGDAHTVSNRNGKIEVGNDILGNAENKNGNIKCNVLHGSAKTVNGDIKK